MSEILAVTVYDRLGNAAATMDCVQGSTVTDDRTQANRRSCSLSVQDPLGIFSPANAGDLLAPGITSGYLVKATCYGNPLGTFIAQSTLVTDTGDSRVVQLTGVDLSWLVTAIPIDAAGYAVNAGTPWTWAIARLIELYAPNLNLSGFTEIPWPTPAILLNPGDEPWTEMATEWGPAIGYELYLDENNVGQLALVPDPRMQPSTWTFIEGQNCGMTEVGHTLTDDSCPNVFQRDGVGPGNTVISSVAADENPNSTTFVGTYGYRLSYEQNTLMASQPQCTNAALMQLYLGLGANEPVVLTLDPSIYTQGVPIAGQMATVTRAKAGLTDALVVMDTIVHSFFPGDNPTITGRRVSRWPA